MCLYIWDLIVSYNLDVMICTESWLRGGLEGLSNAEVFKDEYIAFRRDRNSRGGGVFMCVEHALLAWNHGRTKILRC
jgi:hypothetical protein